MKTILIKLGLSLFTIRFLVVGLAFLLLAGFFPLSTINQYWLQLSTQLLHQPTQQTTESAIAIVQLNSEESGNLHAHPVLAPGIFKLIEQQIKRGGKAIVLLRQEPLITPAQLEMLLTEKQLKSRLQRFRSWENSNKLQIGITNRPATAVYQSSTHLHASQQLTVDTDSGLVESKEDLLTPYLYWLNRQPPGVDREEPNQPFKFWPFAGNGYAYPLLWRDGETFYQDLSLRVLQLVAPMEAQWVPNQGMISESSGFLTGSDATLFPLRDIDESSTGQPPRLTLAQAAKKTNPKQLLIIGAEKDEQLIPFAQAINAIANEQYLRTPPLMSLISWIGLLLITLYLLLLLPIMSQLNGALLTVLLTIGLTGGQVSLQLAYSYWIPVAASMTLLWAGFALMVIHNRQQQRFNNLRQRYQHRSLQLASTLYHQGKLDEASQAILDCETSPEQLSLCYDVALQQEQTQKLEAALHNYQQINMRQKNFKDVKERIKLISSQFTPQQSDTSSTRQFSSTQTMVLPEQTDSTPHLGRYEILREIGRGAMGIVYLGRDPRIARTVAIKTLPYSQLEPANINEMKQRFFREAEAAGRLNHPNIVTIFDMGEEPNMAFIAMDFAKGTPLNKFCKPESLLPVAMVYKIIADVADALSYAHQQQIVHRDIKPGNIVFDPESQEVKVTDFGIARISDDSQTKTGSVMGSPLYMSPEQLKGAKVTGRADIYSLGVTFYQLLTGTVPFDGDSLANLTYQIISSKYKSVRSHRADLPASATRIINRALQKDASKRYQDAAEMAEALRKSINKEFSGKLA